MPILSLGKKSPVAQLWNDYLRAKQLPCGLRDIITSQSVQGTQAIQRAINSKRPSAHMSVDGVAGNLTIGLAITLLPKPMLTAAKVAQAAGNIYPPILRQPLSNDGIQQLFGTIPFVPRPQPGNLENIEIAPTWLAANIGSVHLPQLTQIHPDLPTRLKANKAVVKQIAALCQAWEDNNLLQYINSFDGLYNPRFTRGSRTTLSNHAYGTAFDINAEDNGLNKLPALLEERGTVLPLVPLANHFGFAWGGHYQSRFDGMHFEAVAIFSDAELTAAKQSA